MRILFVLENFHPRVGGVETMFLELGTRLVRRGHEVTVLTSGVAGSPREEVLPVDPPLKWGGIEKRDEVSDPDVRPGIRIVRTPWMNRYAFTFLAPLLAIRLARQADVIHTTTYNAVFPAWIASVFARRKLVTTVHEIYGSRWSEMEGMSAGSALLHRALEFLSAAWPAAVKTCPSDATLRDLRALPLATWGCRAVRIYHGIDEQLFSPESADSGRGEVRAQMEFIEDEFVLLYFGRPAIAKGADVLARSFKNIAHEIPRLRLVMLLGGGGGFISRRREIERLLAPEIAAGRAIVRDAVPRAELPVWLGAADAVVVPSFAEGFGFSAAEACSSRRPVIVTTAGSLPEVVSGRVIFVAPCSVSSLEEGIRRAAAGDFETLPARHFSWDGATGEYERMYRELGVRVQSLETRKTPSS